MKTSSEVLNSAADLISTHGWTQHAYEHDGHFCVAGALDEIEGPGNDTGAWSRLFQYLGGLSAWGSVVDWNDAPGRTAEEVIAALRAAAEQ